MKNICQLISCGFIASLFVVTGCASKNGNLEEADCPPKACTMEFRSVGVLFKDASGDTLTVNDYEVRKKRDGEKLPSGANDAGDGAGAPWYLVANDGDKADLTVEGDTLLISAQHPKSDKTQSFEMIVAGGRCECHVSKIAGDEVLVFNAE